MEEVERRTWIICTHLTGTFVIESWIASLHSDRALGNKVGDHGSFRFVAQMPCFFPVFSYHSSWARYQQGKETSR